MSLPEVTEIQRWRLRPGDRLVVSVEATLPADFPVLVHGNDVSMEVVTDGD
jgi:hypothetical protein